MSNDLKEGFSSIVDEIFEIGKLKHTDAIFNHAKFNSDYIQNSLRDLPKPEGKKAEKAIVVCAGPSLKKRGILQKLADSNYEGSIVAIDGTLVACLKHGIIPDYVLTLDPHLTRIVRWFGDPDLEKHLEPNDYFQRQDLNVDFRGDPFQKNQDHIDIVNKYADKIKLIICTAAPNNVTVRTKDAGFNSYWFNPIIDDPTQSDSKTRELYRINKVPAINTGGTVGTAGWVFAASTLNIPEVAVVGMDYGYPAETPYDKTQTYYELLEHTQNIDEIEDCFPKFTFPLTNEKYFTDPTYFWYRRNFLQLMEKATNTKTINCTEGGILFHDKIECTFFDDYLKRD